MQAWEPQRLQIRRRSGGVSASRSVPGGVFLQGVCLPKSRRQPSTHTGKTFGPLGGVDMPVIAACRGVSCPGWPALLCRTLALSRLALGGVGWLALRCRHGCALSAVALHPACGRPAVGFPCPAASLQHARARLQGLWGFGPRFCFLRVRFWVWGLNNARLEIFRPPPYMAIYQCVMIHNCTSAIGAAASWAAPLGGRGVKISRRQ